MLHPRRVLTTDFQTYGPSEHGPELLFPDALVQAVVTEIVRADHLAAPVEAGARFEAFQHRNLDQLANGVHLAVDRLVAHTRPPPEHKPCTAPGAGALAVCERSPHHADTEWDRITRLLGDRGYRVHQSERFGATNPLALACQDWKQLLGASSS